MLRKVPKILGFAFTLLALLGSVEAAEPTVRIPSRIDASQTFVLNDNTPRIVVRGHAVDKGAVPTSQMMPRMFMHFAMTQAQRADLNQLLTDLQDRHSPQFHKFLTPEQYAVRFGLGSKDIASVTRWLETNGFSDIQVGRSATWVSFSGTAGRAEAAFRTPVHRYMVDGEVHVANTTDPQLPKALQGIVESIRGLHNFALKPNILRLHPNFTSSISGSHFLTPDDWATIYDVQPLYGQGFDGTGVNIAVMGQSDVLLSDIQAFRSAAGLPANNPTVIVPAGDRDPGYQNGDEVESDLDLEWAGGIAKNANIIFVTACAQFGGGVNDSLTYAIDNNIAPIISFSYGLCEADEGLSDANTQNSLFQQANAQGITILASSGDTGAAACDQGITETAATLGLAVSYPASSPYVTGVGGTTFNDGFGTYWNSTNNASGGSAIGYIPETAWNDGFQSATGGGASIFFPKPTWQRGNSVPNDNARDVPDVAFAASPSHDGYLICGNGWCTNGFRNSTNNLDVIGGTSAGTPSFAGALALLVQKMGRLGNINPNLYLLAGSSSTVFHDIPYTSSTGNQQPCQANTPNCSGFPNPEFGYLTQNGYDQVTGWGSVDISNLSAFFNADFTVSATPSTLTIQPGGSGTATATITPQSNFTGNVSLSCSVDSNLAAVGVTCSVPSTPVSSNGSATVTISADQNADLAPRIPTGPNFGRRLPLVLSLPLLIFLGFLLVRHKPQLSSPLAYVSSSVLVLIIAVSCGGGGSTGVPSPVVSPLVVACTVPTTGMVGTVYSGSCSASGGTAPYSFVVTSGQLPAGVSLNASSGAISGTPSTYGTASFTVQVSDVSAPTQFATQAENVVIAPLPLAVSCSPTTGTVGVSLSARCVGTGGIPPYSFSLTSGTVPPGLTFFPGPTVPTGGYLTGTPTAAGTSLITFGITDTASPAQSATQNVSLVISPGVISLTCSLPQPQVAAAYSNKCTFSGGIGPYTSSVVAGSLPPGLGMNIVGSNLVFSGIPTIAGTYNFTVKIADGESPAQSTTQAISLTVTPNTNLVISSCTYPSAQVGVFYNSGSCTVTGGASPYTFSSTAVPLPPGLIAYSGGALYGSPTAKGTYSFPLQVTDSSATPKTATYQVTNFVVQPRASVSGVVTITATSGGLTNTTTVNVTVP